MPGKRTPADPGEMSDNVSDANPNRAGIQSLNRETGIGQWDPGEAPVENAYREIPRKADQ